MQPKRRDILKAGLATGLFLPLPHAWVWAQTEGTLKLLKAPKLALVVGNGKYKDAPELKNAPNDAKAVAEALKASGFAVTALMDAGKDSLVQAIRDYVHAMEQKKAVGLFYFAGHGVQLDWRNYMLPVDAAIDVPDDVMKHSVDVARLMEGLGKASNPMNIIILDACREDPFGKARKPQRGLSQMDAPAQTILAYATSPGNVASDGDGANGLYTENLLREMRIPEAKVEDVFKRVRLAVRRKSNGAQIPWESTSLEEDFWFLPPKELKKISDEERERLFKEEQAAWERAKQAVELAAKQAAEQAARAAREAAEKAAKTAPQVQSTTLAPLEEYMRRYPSGDFSELAQAQLDRVLALQGERKVAIASQEGNPYTKGSGAFAMENKVGDSYTTRISDLISKAVMGERTAVVQRITDDAVYFSNGLVTDLLGNTRRTADGRAFSDNQTVPAEFAVGKQWVTRYTGSNGPVDFTNEVTWRVVAREQVTVPAGTFNAFRVEANGISRQAFGPQNVIKFVAWFEPSRLRLPVMREDVLRQQGSGRYIRANRFELLAYKLA